MYFFHCGESPTTSIPLQEVARRKSLGIMDEDWAPGRLPKPKPVDAKGRIAGGASYALDPLGAWAMAAKAIEESKRVKRKD